MKRVFLTLLTFSWPLLVWGQANYWQQKAKYTMEVALNANAHRVSGSQKLEYTNNSPDELTTAYYHLYFNAFQPGSMMDVRSRTIADPDKRVGDRIAALSESEIGYQKVKWVKLNGKPCTITEDETILVVKLPEAIKPGATAVFELEFEAQVPLQIRRSGRYNAEGVAYTMTQWYPKMAEYDENGWHPNPYIAREFYGIWGDFDVKITVDEKFVVASSGYIQNAKEVGNGYSNSKPKPKNGKLTYHFVAPNVTDFAWAADPDFVHTTKKVAGGPELHFFYKNDSTLAEAWEKLPEYTEKAFQYMNMNFGKYPYEVYNVVQGGDGGMEYAMLTMITGKRSLRSLVGVTVHEMIHSWYQMVMGTNESLYPWMDEGFTSYASSKTMRHLFGGQGDPHTGAYSSYFYIVDSGKEEPLTTHSDHYKTNVAYSIASYSKGEVFLHQLGYIIGQPALDRTMKRYFETWKHKHPDAFDFIKIAEAESGMVLDWYLEYFMMTTKTIDYGIKNIVGVGSKTVLTLERIGDMPMPVELRVELNDGTVKDYYMPLLLMRGEKPLEYEGIDRTLLPDWRWVEPAYKVLLPFAADQIKSIALDPSERTADVDRSNNQFDMQAFLEESK